jgi:Fe2+ or Zn2+ uptake regulation protein
VKSAEELTSLFRSRGRKVTAQRQRIFWALQGDVSHPTAESVHEAVRADMETISLKTVYQTLNELAAMGEVLVLDLGTGTSRFDPNVESVHHHLVCRSCGKVRDLHADFRDVTIPAGCGEDFEVGQAEVVFRGLCGECRAHRTRRSGSPPSRARHRAPRQHRSV